MDGAGRHSRLRPSCRRQWLGPFHSPPQRGLCHLPQKSAALKKHFLLVAPPTPPHPACLSWQKVQRREANRRRHRLTEPTTKALCQTPLPPPPCHWGFSTIRTDNLAWLGGSNQTGGHLTSHTVSPPCPWRHAERRVSGQERPVPASTTDTEGGPNMAPRLRTLLVAASPLASTKEIMYCRCEAGGRRPSSAYGQAVQVIPQPPDPTISEHAPPNEHSPDIPLASRSVHRCVVLPGLARGWMQEPFPAHTTIVYSMTQVNAGHQHQGAIVGHGQISACSHCASCALGSLRARQSPTA